MGHFTPFISLPRLSKRIVLLVLIPLSAVRQLEICTAWDRPRRSRRGFLSLLPTYQDALGGQRSPKAFKESKKFLLGDHGTASIPGSHAGPPFSINSYDGNALTAETAYEYQSMGSLAPEDYGHRLRWIEILFFSRHLTKWKLLEVTTLTLETVWRKEVSSFRGTAPSVRKQLSVLCFGFLEGRKVRIGIFPDLE